MPTTVTLGRAYRFVCSSCEHVQYGDMIGYDVDLSKEPEAFEACYGFAADSYEGRKLIDDGSAKVEALRVPRRVTCDACEKTFPTADAFADDPDV